MGRIIRELWYAVIFVIRFVIRELIRRPLRMFRRNYRRFIMSYFIGVLPFGYTTTATTTQLDFADWQNIGTTLFNSSEEVVSNVVNVATGGLAQPIRNGIDYYGGQLEVWLGERNDDRLRIQRGINRQLSGSSWFRIGETPEQREDIQSETPTSDGGYLDIGLQTPMYDGAVVYSPYQHGEYYEVLGLAAFNMDSFPEQAEYYVDAEDRPHEVYGTITQADLERDIERLTAEETETLPGMEHQQDVMIPTVRGTSQHVYMYTPSYLLPTTLGGTADGENVFVGTHTLNYGESGYGGMQYVDNRIQQYLSSHKDSTVYYHAHAVYYNGDVIPRYVMVAFMSEDLMLNERVQVFNTANAWHIDYATGALSVQSIH